MRRIRWLVGGSDRGTAVSFRVFSITVVEPVMCSAERGFTEENIRLICTS